MRLPGLPSHPGFDAASVRELGSAGIRTKVALLFRATEPRDLAKVEWLAHDCWFDADAVRANWQSGAVAIPFGNGRSTTPTGFWFHPPRHTNCILAISNVTAISVDDKAQVGWVDINSVRYDEARHSLVLESGFPVSVTFAVDRLDVAVTIDADPHVGEGGLSWYTDGKDVSAVLAECW